MTKKILEQVENAVRKKEISPCEQFLVLTVFSMELYCRHKNKGSFGNGLRLFKVRIVWQIVKGKIVVQFEIIFFDNRS